MSAEANSQSSQSRLGPMTREGLLTAYEALESRFHKRYILWDVNCPGLEDGEIASPQLQVESAVDVMNQHPLVHSWTFWFSDATAPPATYTVATREEFWCLYNNVMRPTKLLAGTHTIKCFKCLHVFKDGKELLHDEDKEEMGDEEDLREWEGPTFANGGKWTANTRCGKSALDTFWLHTLLALMGEEFDDPDEIYGAVVSVRRAQGKVAIWTNTALDRAAQISIGRKWKAVLQGYHDELSYYFHEDDEIARYTV